MGTLLIRLFESFVLVDEEDGGDSDDDTDQDFHDEEMIKCQLICG